MANIGFIGLGIMGTPMAGHLIAHGHTLYAYTRGRVPASLLAAGARACASGAEVAAQADVIFIMVPDTPQVEEVLFGADGVAAGLEAGSGARKVVVDMSSISPVATKEFARRVNALGCDYLDAPVSGAEVGATAATLTMMVGGSEAAFDRVLPLFKLMGKNITRAGADPARVREALMGGFASSRILEVHGERMIKRSFAPGFRIDLHRKDLNLALATARQLGVALPSTATAQELFNSCAAHDGGGWDHSAMVRALEIMANFEIGAPR